VFEGLSASNSPRRCCYTTGQGALTDVKKRVLHQQKPSRATAMTDTSIPSNRAGLSCSPSSGGKLVPRMMGRLIDLPVAILIDHADLAGSAPVPLASPEKESWILPDAAEL